MKDFIGNELNVNDDVAVVYHPESYVFSIEKGKVTRITEKSVSVTLENGENPSFQATASSAARNEMNNSADSQTNNDIITRVVKLTVAEDSEATKNDAVGQPLSIGDIVAFQKPIELGNTCKGFEYAGNVTKLTASFVFAEINGESKRKKYDAVIVLKHNVG